MDTLNFLKFQPLANWFDYFLDRQKFFDLIADADKGSRDVIGQLLDQFAEQALNSEKELVQMERKLMDEDDIIYMRHKVSELWMCALCCLAAVGWDLEFLIKNSNVIQIRAMMDRLCRWVFDENLFIESVKSGESFFLVLCKAYNEEPSLIPHKMFALWIYALWILIVDANARFPSSSAKPTVSNPLNQIDQNLVQAERISQTVTELRRCLPSAMAFLNKMLERKNAEICMLRKECFRIESAAISERSLAVLRVIPAPDLESVQSPLICRLIFEKKTQFSLALVHFAARHFKHARMILESVENNFDEFERTVDEQQPRILRNLLSINKSTLKAYSSALDFSNKRQRIPLNGVDVADTSRTLIKSVIQRANLTPKMVFDFLLLGSTVSKRFLRLLGNELFRQEFIEEVARRFTTFETADDPCISAAEKRQRIHIYATLYFFCSLSPGFYESLSRHPVLKLCSRWRKLATTVENPLAEPPTNERLQELSSSGPPLWNALTSFSLPVLREALNAMGTAFKLPYRHKFSEVVGEPILKRADRRYNQIVLFLWKLEQLVELKTATSFEALLNGFAGNVITDLLDENVKALIMFDYVRANIDIWNRSFRKVENTEEFAALTENLLTRTSATMSVAMRNDINAFRNFVTSLISFLLNNRQCKLIIQSMISNCFQSPYTDLSVNYVAKYLYLAHELQRRDTAAALIAPFWKVMWPTFELPSHGGRRHGAPPLLSRHQFMNYLINIKDQDALDFFFGFLSTVYNATLAVDAEQTQSRQTIGLQAAIIVNRRIFVQDEAHWCGVVFDGRHLDATYMHVLFEVLCRNAMLVNPVNVHWLRICGDFCFVSEKYEQAVSYYLEVIIAIQRGSELELTEAEMNNLFTKISISCAALQMPTLAAIVGQYKTNPEMHYAQVEWILQNTPNSVDAGLAYFPLISSIELAEYMTAAYNKFGLVIYAQNLLKAMPTRAINANNQPSILRREVERRKKRFLNVLCNQFFKQNI